MREIRPSGSERGVALTSSSLPRSVLASLLWNLEAFCPGAVAPEGAIESGGQPFVFSLSI